jgi:predicted AlkP superfamily pyrophosphatase or phosphodiesterase
VILVSDHGLYELSVDALHSIFIDELIDKKDRSVRLVNGGTQMHLYIENQSKRDSVYTVLKKKEANYTIYKKEEFPARWNYNHDRVGDLLMEAKPGYYIRDVAREQFLKSAPLGEKRGVHGYDPEATTDVRGIFYAQGPNIKSGKHLEPFQNIHVYPLVAKILGLPLPKIDGKPEVLDTLYKK